MVHPLVILVFLVVLLRDEVGPPFLGGWLQAWLGGGPAGAAGAVAALTIAPLAVLWLATDWFVARQARALDTTGRLRAASRAETGIAASRVAAAVWHALAVLGLGWLDAVRWWVGDLVVVDELAAVLPVGLFLVLGWWTIYPIHRRLREAVLVRELDEGRPLYPILSRGKFVWSAVRHHLALVGIPVALLVGWSEAVEHGIAWLAATSWAEGVVNADSRGLAALLLAPGALAVVVPVLQFSGTVFVFAVLPLLMRRVWDTLPLGAGPLREALLDLCRAHRVGVRDLLVWRTNGSMINGAVMGVAAPVRYILLTDALLDSLPEEQVRAVMAHEIGHVRRKHMLWLLIAAVASWLGVSVAMGWGADRLLGEAALSPALEGALTAATILAALVVGLVVFGFASRRFEWQADAFAVQHLSGARPGRRDVTISREAVEAMAGALAAVARLNNIPRDKFSWRHGSIASRQERLRRLAGMPADGLPIDRQARLVKALAFVVLVGGGVLAAMDTVAAAGA